MLKVFLVSAEYLPIPMPGGVDPHFLNFIQELGK
jgi:hypothetical protein